MDDLRPEAQGPLNSRDWGGRPTCHRQTLAMGTCTGGSTNSVWASLGKILFWQGMRCHQRDPGQFFGNIYILQLCILCSSELLQDFGLLDGQFPLFPLGSCMFISLCVCLYFVIVYILMLLSSCVCSFAPWRIHTHTHTYIYIYIYICIYIGCKRKAVTCKDTRLFSSIAGINWQSVWCHKSARCNTKSGTKAKPHSFSDWLQHNVCWGRCTGSSGLHVLHYQRWRYWLSGCP
jgi:hypothetical protein